MAIVLAALLLTPGVTRAQTDDRVMTAYREKTQVVRPCPRDPGAIIVCGNRAERNARERIPLPDERDTAQGGIVRGEAPRASAAKVRVGMCGVNASESAGCNGGLDLKAAARMLGKVVAEAIDPDVDVAEPSALPDRYKGATPP